MSANVHALVTERNIGKAGGRVETNALFSAAERYRMTPQIDRSDLPESSLCFEITESAAVSNMRKAQSFIDRLQLHPRYHGKSYI